MGKENATPGTPSLDDLLASLLLEENQNLKPDITEINRRYHGDLSVPDVPLYSEDLSNTIVNQDVASLLLDLPDLSSLEAFSVATTTTEASLLDTVVPIPLADASSGTETGEEKGGNSCFLKTQSITPSLPTMELSVGHSLRGSTACDFALPSRHSLLNPSSLSEPTSLSSSPRFLPFLPPPPPPPPPSFCSSEGDHQEIMIAPVPEETENCLVEPHGKDNSSVRVDEAEEKSTEEAAEVLRDSSDESVREILEEGEFVVALEKGEGKEDLEIEMRERNEDDGKDEEEREEGNARLPVEGEEAREHGDEVFVESDKKREEESASL